jgi:hypothetical protein
MTISNIVSVMPRDLSLLPCLAVQIIKERAVESIDIFDGDQLMLTGGSVVCFVSGSKEKDIVWLYSFAFIIIVYQHN